MEKKDGRALSPEQQHERRKEAVRMHKQGKGIDEIAASLGMGHVTVRKCIKVARQQGAIGLKPKVRGRKLGDQRQLSIEQELSIQKQICENSPKQLNLTFALWTRQAVARLIEQECATLLPIRTVDSYLKRWGFTPPRPTIRADEQEPKSDKVKAWLGKEYKDIEARAKLKNAEIHWVKEAVLVSTDVCGRGCQFKEQPPIAFAVADSRQKLSMISAVTNQGKARWMVFEKNLDADKFIKFLDALIKDTPKRVFLIVDHQKFRNDRHVNSLLVKRIDKIELHYLPSSNIK